MNQSYSIPASLPEVFFSGSMDDYLNMRQREAGRMPINIGIEIRQYPTWLQEKQKAIRAMIDGSVNFPNGFTAGREGVKRVKAQLEKAVNAELAKQ